MSDRPFPELGGRTPLMTAAKPNMDRLARAGRIGLVRTCPAGFPIGTEIGTMTLMGYEPARYFSGRGPLEAMGRGIELRKSEVAWRCNLVTVKGEVMEDYSAGYITDPEARQLIQMLDKRLGGEEIRFHSGVSYRHLMIWRGGSDDVRTMAPHDIVGAPWRTHVPKGRGEARLLSLMEDSRVLLDGHEVNRARRAKGLKTANMIWLWSPGKTPVAPAIKDKYGVTGAVISAVDVVRGIGVMAGLEVIKVPGATGYFDTNYKGKGEAAAKALKTNDFVFVHVEAPDEAGHQGLASEKIKAIEAIDREIVGNLLRVAPKLGGMAILVAPDHATPLAVKSHTDDPVPYILWNSGPMVAKQPAAKASPVESASEPVPTAAPESAYDEAVAGAGSAVIEEGWLLLDQLFGRKA